MVSKGLKAVKLHRGTGGAEQLIFIKFYSTRVLYTCRGCRKGYIAVKTTSDMDSVSKAKNAHNSSEVMRIKCSPDGKYVATSGFDGNVHVWRFPHLELIYSLTESSCSKVVCNISCVLRAANF